MTRPDPHPVPRITSVPTDVRTVLLGAFIRSHVDAIGRALDGAGIVWWAKVPGLFTGIWEQEVHIFVDRQRLDDARRLAAEAIAD